MQNNTLEVQAPSPNNTTTFSLNLPAGAQITVSIRSNQIYFDCFWQGPNVSLVQRNFGYLSMGTAWDDESPNTKYNFYQFVAIASGTYVLVEYY